MNCSGHGTSLAQESNRIDIDPELKDDWGVPALRVTYKDHPDDMKHAKWQVERAVEIMDAAGAKQIVPGEIVRRLAGSTCSALAAWAMILQARSSTSTTAPMMCGTCSCATAPAWSHQAVASPHKPSKPWPSAPQST
jgi:hypothetical protein